MPSIRSARSVIGSIARHWRSTWRSLYALPGLRAWRGRQLRRLWPLDGGGERGQPVIRYYWEEFLQAHRADVRGDCLEVGGTQTVQRLGGTRVRRADAIDMAPRDGVTVVADLSRADAIAGDAYDCFILPFTMHLVYDIDAALHHALRLLKPGGVLLVNFPCVDYYFADGLDMHTGRPLFLFWWFTPIQVDNLLRRAALSADDYSVSIAGNLFARVAHQMNLPVEELTRTERDHRDAGHPLLISVRIVKPRDWRGRKPEYRDPWLPATTPVQWTPQTGHYPRR